MTQAAFRLVSSDAADMNDERTEPARLSDRRENQWTKPPVLLGLVGLLFQAMSLFLFVGGGLLAIYITSKSNDMTSDMTNAQVVGEIQKLSLEVKSIGNLVQQASNTNATQERDIDTLTRDVTEIKSDLADLTKTFETNKQTQMDYNFKLGNDLTAVKAGANK